MPYILDVYYLLCIVQFDLKQYAHNKLQDRKLYSQNKNLEAVKILLKVNFNSFNINRLLFVNFKKNFYKQRLSFFIAKMKNFNTYFLLIFFLRITHPLSLYILLEKNGLRQHGVTQARDPGIGQWMFRSYFTHFRFDYHPCFDIKSNWRVSNAYMALLKQSEQTLITFTIKLWLTFIITQNTYLNISQI